MRGIKQGETRKNRRGGIYEYFDSLDRNTFYCNPNQMKWVSKEWIRLPNGEDRETFVESSTGYFRRHWYDIHTGELVKELDSRGEINLIDKRQAWNPKDDQISLEYRQRGNSVIGKSTELF